MESKLLAAAKALLEACRKADDENDLSLLVDGSMLDGLDRAIREAEADAAPTPKPDVMKVKFNASTGAETYDSSNVKVGEAHSALWDMDQYLRGRIKYEDLPEPVCTALEAAREKLNELTTAAGLTLE